MSTKVAPRPIAPAPKTLAQELQARLNNGHLDVREVQQLERGWGRKPVTAEQAREFRQTVLGWASRMPAASRRELQQFIEARLPTLTAPDPKGAAPRDVTLMEELQVKALGQGRIDLQGTRELISQWAQRPVTADEAQSMTVQLLGMTGTFGTREARQEVQQFLRDKLPTQVSNPEQLTSSPDTQMRLASMVDGRVSAGDAKALVARWAGQGPLSQDQARALSDAVVRNQGFIDPGEARETFKGFIDGELPKLTRLVAAEAGPGATTFADALNERLGRGGAVSGGDVEQLLQQYGGKALTVPQANQLKQTILGSAVSLQPEARAKLQRYLETELPGHVAAEPGQALERVPADDLRTLGLGRGSLGVAEAERLVKQWGASPVSARDARAMVRALADNSAAFESNAAIGVVQRFVQDKLPGLTEKGGLRDLGFELKAALADDGRLDAGDARRLIDSWRSVPSVTWAQHQQLTQMVQAQAGKIEPGEARALIDGFVGGELAKKVTHAPAEPPRENAKVEVQAQAAPPAPAPTLEPQSLWQALSGKIQNDGHLDLAELSGAMKAFGDKPLTAAQATELRSQVLGQAGRIQPDARRALQRWLENDLPRLTADDPNVPSTPTVSQQLELKALGPGALSLKDTRALISQWSQGPLTAQQANEMKYAVTGQPGRFASNEALAQMQAFLQGTLPGLVKDPQNLAGDPSLDVRVAMLTDGRIDAARADRLVKGWQAGPRLTGREANELRSTIANSLRFVDEGPARQRLVDFAERDLPGHTLPTTELDGPRPPPPAPKTLQEALDGLTSRRDGDEPYEYRGGRQAVDPQKVAAALEQFKGQNLDPDQADGLRRTAAEVASLLDPGSRRALQTYLERELPAHTATEPGRPQRFDPFSQLQLKALGEGTISESQATDLVRAWRGRDFTAAEAQQLSQVVSSQTGLFESTEAIRKVQRFIRDELPRKVSDPASYRPSFSEQVRVATLGDGRLSGRDAERLVAGWKREGMLDPGRGNELVQSVLDRSFDLDPAAGRALRGFIDGQKQLSPDFSQQLQLEALGQGRLDLAGAERLVESWKKKQYTPEQAGALVDAVVGSAGFIEAGQTRQTLQRFLERELPKRTAAGPDGKKAPLRPDQQVSLMELTGGRVDAGEASRLKKGWDEQMTPGRAEAIRRAVKDATLDRRADGTMSRFVDENLTALTVGQALTNPNNAKLAWTPPFANEDGSLLTDLVGYEIDWGGQPGRTDGTVRVDDPAATTAEVQNLTSGTWYFRARAIGGTPGATAQQRSSRPSNEVSKLVK